MAHGPSALPGVPQGVEGSRRRRPLIAMILEGSIVLLGFIVLAFFLYFAQFSGTVRWVLGVVLLGVLAALAWAYVSRRSSEPSPLLGRARLGSIRDGELFHFSEAVRRADAGLPYSQSFVTVRAREAFGEHVRLALGLSEEAMRDLRRNPAALRERVRDEALADFLAVAEDSEWDRNRWAAGARARGGFPAEFRQILARMEEWR